MEFDEIYKNLEGAMDRIIDESKGVPDRIRQLTTKQGFIDAFWGIVGSKDITHVAAYETLENEYRAFFKNRKYKNYASFRRRRDSETIDEDNEYMYVFYDPLENITYLGITTAPEQRFRLMHNSNPNLIYATLKRNFDIDFAMGLMDDYKVTDNAYRVPTALYYLLVGFDNPAQYPSSKMSKEFSDLMIKHRGKSGVYVFEDEEENVLYVGVSKDLHKRVRGSFKERFKYYPKAVYIKIYPCNQSDAIILETYLIAHHRPIFNRLGASKYKPTLKIEKLPKPSHRVRVNDTPLSY